MSVDKQLESLVLGRKRTVNQLASQSWGADTLLRSPETPRLEPDRPGLTGSQLIQLLQDNAKELQGRVAGRNNDDARFLCKGLAVLHKEWEALEAKASRAEHFAQARGRGGGSDSARGASSPESSDGHYVVKQQQRIQQLEKQEGRLLAELAEVKSKWEGIMARTMEHQASVHRQQMREREAQVAQKDAELERLRQQVRVPRQPNPTPKPAVATASRRDSEESDSSPRPEQYLMAGRMAVGQTLQILGPTDENSKDNYQWYQIDSNGDWLAISGATRNQYSPEPADQGFALGCCISPSNSTSASSVKRVSSKKTVTMDPDLMKWVDSLMAEGGAVFGVVVVQKNGMLHTNREVCALEITPHNLVLRLPNAVTLQPYSASVQVCGARGAGGAAAQGVFLALRAQEVYMLACETARERNACISLIRTMAGLHGLNLRGP